MATRINIFRAGTHTASNGKRYDFSESMLRNAVAAYDPAVYEAQLVVGHPKDNDPSYGGVAALHFGEAGDVDADTHNVDPAFAEMVNAKRFPHRSSSWYLPDAPGNPKPGVMYLRHVGFLGAQPPAIKGLKAASFSASDDGVIEFADWSDVKQAGLFRRIREFLIANFSLAVADQTVPESDLQSLEDAARAEPAESAMYSEFKESHAMTEAELKAAQEKLQADQAALAQLKATLTTQEASFAEREQSLSTQERTARRAEHSAFIDGLIREGKFLPVHRDAVIAFMDLFDASDVVEFKEGETDKKLHSVEWFKGYLQSQPKLVEFREVAASSADEGTASFAAPHGFSVDQEQIDVHAKAVAHRKAHPEVSYLDAVKAVSA